MSPRTRALSAQAERENRDEETSIEVQILLTWYKLRYGRMWEVSNLMGRPSTMSAEPFMRMIRAAWLCGQANPELRHKMMFLRELFEPYLKKSDPVPGAKRKLVFFSVKSGTLKASVTSRRPIRIKVVNRRIQAVIDEESPRRPLRCHPALPMPAPPMSKVALPVPIRAELLGPPGPQPVPQAPDLAQVAAEKERRQAERAAAREPTAPVPTAPAAPATTAPAVRRGSLPARPKRPVDEVPASSQPPKTFRPAAPLPGIPLVAAPVANSLLFPGLAAPKPIFSTENMAPAVAELERRAAGGPAAIVPTTPVSPAVTAPVASKPAPPTETPGLAKTLPAAPKSVAPVTNPLAGMPAALSLVDPSPTALSPAPKSLAPPSPAASTSAASSPAVPSPAAQSPTAPLPIAASPPASPAAVSPAVSPAAQSTAPEPEPSKAGIIDPTLSDEDTTPRATPARAPKPSFAVVSRKRKAAIVLQAPLGPKKASVLPAVKKRNVATAEIIIVSD